MAATTPHFSEEYLNANKGPSVVAIIIIFPILALIIVSLRLYTRFRIVQNPAFDDYAITVALIFSIATSICQGFQVYNGMGRHIQAVTMDQAIGSLKALFASIMMYNFGLTLTKLSILFQYIRINVNGIVRKFCWGLFWFTILNSVQTFMTGTFSCYPVAKFWDDRIPGRCVNKPALWYSNAAINIIQDIWLIVIPIFIIRKLLLPRREKITLVLILGLGGFASCASVFRLHALYHVAISQDITWDNPGTATWSAIELNVGIICASLPTLRALASEHFPRVFSSAALAYRDAGRGGYMSSQSGKRKFTSDSKRVSHIEGTIVVKHEIDIEGGLGRSESDLEGGAEERNSRTYLNSASDNDVERSEDRDTMEALPQFQSRYEMQIEEPQRVAFKKGRDIRSWIPKGR